MAVEFGPEQFRYGFICFSERHAPPATKEWDYISSNWRRIPIGFNWVLWAHPESQVSVFPQNASAEIVIIGEVLSLCKTSVEGLIKGIRFDGSLFAGLEILDDLSGRFALIVAHQDRLTVANDSFGSRSVFYWAGDPAVFGSYSGLVAACTDARERDDIRKLMQSRVYKARRVRYLPGDATIFDEISALIPNHYLSFPACIQKRYWPSVNRTECSIEQFFEEADRYLERFCGFISSDWRTPLVGITGGIDTRVLLGVFERNKVSFEGVTWLNQYLKEVEIPLVDQIVTTLKIPHSFIAPSRALKDRISRVSQLNSGGYRKESQLTESMYARYGDRNMVFIRGYGGEIIRGFYNLKTKALGRIDPGLMAKLYWRNTTISKQLYPEAQEIVVRAFEGFYERGDYGSLSELGYDLKDIFYWEHRMGMWGSAMLNELDAGMNSLVGLNSRRMYDKAFGLQREDRLTKELLRRLIGRHSEHLYNLPYF